MDKIDKNTAVNINFIKTFVKTKKIYRYLSVPFNMFRLLFKPCNFFTCNF